MATSGFSARSMIGKGANTIPGSLGSKSPKKLHGMGRTLEAETMNQEGTKASHAHSKSSGPASSPPPSKTSNCKDTHSLWKSVQDCHASLTVENPRHFEFAVANLCFLLKAYGKELDNYVKFDIDKIFQTLRILAMDPSKRPTTRMQLLRVIELRARNWDSEQRCQTQQATMQNKAEICKKDIKLVHSPLETKTVTHPRPSAPKTETQRSRSEPDSPDSTKQPSPKSTGFWDALTTIPEFYPHLPPILEETPSSEGPPHGPHPVKVDSDQASVNVPTSPVLPYNSMPPTGREKREMPMLPLTKVLPDEGSVFGAASTTPTGYASPRTTTCTSPVDPSLGPAGRIRRLSSGSSCSSNQPLHYSREFLLKCWDSPLCRVMPPALQHTIPHSDVYYLIRIPTFEDPTFLLNDDSSPPNVKSTRWGPYVDQSNRRRHSSWPSTMNSEAEPSDNSVPAYQAPPSINSSAVVFKW